MGLEFYIIVVHQLLFQGMFMAKNLLLKKKIGAAVRGRNIEATVATLFFAAFIVLSIAMSLIVFPTRLASAPRIPMLAAGSALLLLSLIVSAIALVGLGDSWRVGVVEAARPKLVTDGIYSYSRNPYFLAYLLYFPGAALVLRDALLLGLALIAYALTRWMVAREEQYLLKLHGETYAEYVRRVPRFLLF